MRRAAARPGEGSFLERFFFLGEGGAVAVMVVQRKERDAARARREKGDSETWSERGRG